MELADLDTEALYFERLPAPEVEALLAQAGQSIAAAELLLLRAWLMEPENLHVLMALFRHYHRVRQLREAASVAERLMVVAGAALGFPADWRLIGRAHLSRAVGHSIGLLRFYLLAMKARAALGLRLRQVESAREMLLKVRELDGSDRLGVTALIEIVDNQPALRSGGAL